MVEFLLHAVGKTLHLDLGPFGSDHDGMSGAGGLCRSKLLSDLLLSQRETDTPPFGTELLCKGKGIRTTLLVGDHEVDLDGGISLESCILLSFGHRALRDKFQQDGVADTESDGRQVSGSITQICKESVVTTAAGNGSQPCMQREGLEDYTGIVGQTSHHSQIRADIVA